MANKYWVGGNGNWSDTSHWSLTSGGTPGAAKPNSGDVVYINNGSTVSGDSAMAFMRMLMTSGGFTTNNYSVSAKSFTASGDSPMTINLGSSTLSFTYSYSGLSYHIVGWSVGGANITLNAGTSSISIDGGSNRVSDFYGGGLTYYDVSFPGYRNVYMTGANTFHNLSITHPDTPATPNKYLEMAGNTTVTGLLTITGYSSSQRIYMTLNYNNFGWLIGNQVTISAQSVSVAYVNFQDVIGSGVAAPFTGTSLGDGGNNSGITFDAPVDHFWVNNGGDWGEQSHWSTVSGGPGGIRVPLPQDNVYFDANSFTLPGQTVTTGATQAHYLGHNVSFSNVTNNPSINFIGDIFGSLSLSSGVTYTDFSIDYVSREDCSFNQNGVTLPSGAYLGFSLDTTNGGDTVTFLSDINLPGDGSLYIYNGNVETGIYDISTNVLYMFGEYGQSNLYLNSNTLNLPHGTARYDNSFVYVYTPSILHAENATINLYCGDYFYSGQIYVETDTTIDKLFLYPTVANADFQLDATNDSSLVTVTVNEFHLNAANTPTLDIYTGNWVFGLLDVNGTSGNLIDFYGDAWLGPGTYSNVILTVNSATVSYTRIGGAYAIGSGTPIDASVGCVDDGDNTGWCFTEACLLVSALFQDGLNLLNGSNYRLITNSNIAAGTLNVKEDTTLIGPVTAGFDSTDFTSVGSTRLSFYPSGNFEGSVTSVSLKEITNPAVNDNRQVKEILTGNTDEGNEIFFRADTQTLQLKSEFEVFSTPMEIVTRSQRGGLVKCFVSLDDSPDWYELQGTASKGVSILKIHSKNPGQMPSPTVARKMRVSWRDGSKQLCRLIQTAIIFMPGSIEHTE